ncbi:hypothetical protein GALMADRAFT_797490 [Galerina marginata CBS 339.88]|uniref:Uncharacterized protein n=1 Tax=Galerina marginata (strain CBS 339.88) TaxID=685588 RepID=A0A067SWX1_GALM3|nr:hypothetical protein GALMADRAFT_797490 [Galerina marginata CBS 339.88]
MYVASVSALCNLLTLSKADYSSPNHRTLSMHQPPPLSLHIGGQSSSGPSLPISNSRSIEMHEPKRPSNRGGLSLHSRSPSDDPGGSYYYGQNSTSFNRHTQYGHGHGHSSSQQHHPHHGQSGPGPQHSGSQYPPFFPGSSSHQSPPPSFMPLQSEFSRGPSSRGGGGGGGQGFGLPPRTSSTGSSSYDNPAMYPMMRTATGSASSQPPGPFPAFLDTEDQGRHQGQAQLAPSLVGLDWPVHNASGGGGPSSSAAPSGPPSSGNFFFLISPYLFRLSFHLLLQHIIFFLSILIALYISPFFSTHSLFTPSHRRI